MFRDNALAQFVIDNAVGFAAVRLFGNDHLEAELVAQAAHVEILLHGVGRGHHGRALEPVFANFLGRGIGDMEEGHGDGGLDFTGNLMHGVGGEDDNLGPCPLKPACDIGQSFPGSRPVAAGLHVGNFGKIDGPEKQFGGVQSAEALANRRIDVGIVMGG